MKFGLKNETIKKINAVFEKFPPIEKAILYGSRAKGSFQTGSDIDLTLVGRNLNLSVMNKIELELDDLLLPYTFDISVFHQITNPELIDHINRIGKTFYLKSN